MRLKYVGVVEDLEFALQFDFTIQETFIGGPQKYLDQYMAFFKTYFGLIIDELNTVSCGTGKMRVYTNSVDLKKFMLGMDLMKEQGFVINKETNFRRILW